MLNEKTIDLSKYRLNKAKEDFETSKELLNLSKHSHSITHSYYSIFHAVRALLAIEEIDFKKHSGVISHFQQNYIKNNIFDKKLSTIIVEAFSIRNKCDYNDYFLVSKDDASSQLKKAEKFISEIENYLNKQVYT